MKKSELRQLIREELNNKDISLNESWTHKGLSNALKELKIQFDDALAQYYDDEGEQMDEKDRKEINNLIEQLYSKLRKYFG